MKFTVKKLNKLESKDKIYEVREGDGFGVKIYPSGTKKFFYSYLIRNRKRRISLGKYPVISLANAHRLSQEYRKKVRDGIDPQDEQQALNASPTIRELATEFINNHSKPKKKTWKEDQRILERYINKKLGTKKAKDVTRREIKFLIDKIALTAPVQANRVLACVRKMFNYAIEVEILEHSPCIGISQPGGKEHSKTRYLDATEIRLFLNNLDQSSLSTTTKNGLKLILFTGQRPGEVCGMHSNEINGNWWTIPSNRSKNGREHKVYLNEFALNIIKDISGFILPSLAKLQDDHVPTQGICTTTLSQALRLRLKDWGIAKFTPHDLRRTCGSHLTSLGFPQLLVGHILNHTDQSITSVYNQYSYDKEKKQAMEAWGNSLNQILKKETLDNIVQMPLQM